MTERLEMRNVAGLDSAARREVVDGCSRGPRKIREQQSAGRFRLPGGFRFDLASALARELHEVDRLSAFFDIIQQDPHAWAERVQKETSAKVTVMNPGKSLEL